MEESPISPVVDSKPELVISAPAINNEPVELDSTPTSPERIKAERREDLSPEELEKRQKLMSERKIDQAVMVDIPETPSAEEFGKTEDPEPPVPGKSGSKSS